MGHAAAEHGDRHGTRAADAAYGSGGPDRTVAARCDRPAGPRVRGLGVRPTRGIAQDPAYGIDFYRQLKDSGAVIVKSPDDVTTGVAEGRFKAGITLDFSARSAITKGSPVELVWPASGAVTMYSPIALVATSANATAARAFIDYVLSPEGQALIAVSGWQPARSDVSGGPPIGGPQVRPDWTAAFARQDELLADYRSIFGE